MKLRPTIANAPDAPVMVESEVAYHLRQELGPVKVWPFVLTGLRRSGADDTLLPYLLKAGRRYYYAMADVEQFIEEFRAENPDCEGSTSPQLLRACDVEPTSPKRRIRYRCDDLTTVSPREGTNATLH